MGGGPGRKGDSQGSGAFNGRPAVTFRYPINPANDLPLPTIAPAQALPGVKLRFKHGDYQMHVSVVSSNNTIEYASASGETTVPNAAISYNGLMSGQAEDALLSQTTLTNTGKAQIKTVMTNAATGAQTLETAYAIQS